MKINILDAGISYRVGHHYQYDLNLLQRYAEGGHDVHFYGFEGMEAEVLGEFEKYAAVTGLFTAFQYKAPEEYDDYSGEITQYTLESAIIAGELRAVRPADIWIWPTLRAQDVAACALRGVDVPVVGCVYWDPGVEARSLSAQLWRDALLFARRSGVELVLASVEAELRHRFMPIVPTGRFAILPQPVDGPPIAAPRAALKRIGFFGHQRDEKGADMMSSLLPRLVADGYAITFHDSGRDCAAPDVPGVDLLGYVENLAAPIAECDLIVLPYDVERYQARGSGILNDCLALGIPVIAPIGTLPGRTIEQYGVGPLFFANREGPIYHSIKLTDRNYAMFAANAHRTAKAFAKRNGSARFAAALLAAGRLRPRE